MSDEQPVDRSQRTGSTLSRSGHQSSHSSDSFWGREVVAPEQKTGIHKLKHGLAKTFSKSYSRSRSLEKHLTACTVVLNAAAEFFTDTGYGVEACIFCADSSRSDACFRVCTVCLDRRFKSTLLLTSF